MTDKQKTKQELIQELDILRQRVAALEQSELACKRAEEALRGSEETYRAVFENTGTATVVIEENTIISLANAEFVGLSGYSLEEIEGKKSWTEFVVKEDLERMQAQHRFRRQNAEKALRHYEFRFVRRNGNIRNIYLSIDLILGTTKSVASLLDITERKRAEEALRETEEKFRLAFDNANTGMCLVDLNGLLTKVNRKMCDIFGYRKEELEGMSVNTIAYPEDQEVSPEFIKHAIAGKNGSLTFEKRYFHKQGHIVWGQVSSSLVRDAEGIPLYFISQVQDITERKRAEEALQDQLHFLQQLLDAIPVPVFYKDRQGVFRGCNVAYEKFVGLTKEQVVGKTVFEVAPQDLADIYYHADETLFSRPGVQVYETSFLHADGNRREIIFNKATYVGADGCVAGLVGIILDITERKQIEKALRKSEERFRELFDHAPVSYHEFDLEGHLTRVNRTELELLGYTHEEMIGQPIWKFNVEEESARKRILGKLAGDISPSKGYELTYRRKDGATIWLLAEDRLILDSGGRITGMRGIFQDITERKLAEEALRRSEKEATRLARENAIMAEIGRIINSTLNIEEVYRRFAEKVKELIPFDRIAVNLINAKENIHADLYVEGVFVPGRQPGDIIPLAGTTMEKVFHTRKGILIRMEDEKELAAEYPGFLPNFQSGIRSALTVPLISRDQVIGGLGLRSKDPGAYTDRDLKLAESIGNQIAGAIANSQLFTERQRLEERLRRAEKMEALGTMAGGVAHDLNNVLGVLVGYSELLLMEIRKGSPLKRHVSNILQSGQRAAAIIQDLLTLARRGVAISEVVNLNDVISDHLKTPEFEKLKAYHPQVTFKTDLDKDLMNIKGSTVHLSKTIMNLLSNAAEAISEHGEVTLLTENRYLDKPIAGYDDIREGDYIVLRVSDNGKGISAQDMGKIFEPFYTKKVMGRSGTGLGLAVVWGTVKDHGGYIDVRSEERKGSTFTLYFPVTREERTTDQPSIPTESYQGRGESILVVDDVKEQRELATIMLGRLGYQVNAVTSGEEAVAYLQRNRVDLLVLDMIMEPGMDGLATYQRVVEINPKQKAIIVSGFSETERLKAAQELGAGAYVRKPYILEKIGLAIRRELDR